jgi:uncharacterized MAPEG superfamily protein
MEEPIAAYWIMLVGALMPYVLIILAKAGPAYDNAQPRDSAALDTPLKRNAYGAHANSIEAFPLFAAAVLLAALRHAPGQTVNVLAGLWLVSRFAYVAVYLAGLHTLRSLLWAVSAGASIAILVVAIQSH